MEQRELIPHLFRTEYRKITAVLCKLFGIKHIGIAEDIVSDTFLLASELWGLKGMPDNPAAWLYAVAKNKTRDFLKHDTIFTTKIATELKATATLTEELNIDLSNENIRDSQLAMIFAVCHPSISAQAQIGLALNLLCGFGIEEIAHAFLTNKETIYKRLNRAKERLRTENARIEHPTPAEIDSRLDTVLTTLYLLFNEGYYSVSQNTSVRKDLCAEAMWLTLMLADNAVTNRPAVNALLSLMCFQSSRLEARTDPDGEVILYEDQDKDLWDQQLIDKGAYYLNRATEGDQLSKYHLEAAIAYWHTRKEEKEEKWENILQLYNKLLQLEYSPIAALNRTYALARANGKEQAIVEALKLNLSSNHLYYALLGDLYSGLDNAKALHYFQEAMLLARSDSDKRILERNIHLLTTVEKND